jgi:hypothetical protein
MDVEFGNSAPGRPQPVISEEALAASEANRTGIDPSKLLAASADPTTTGDPGKAIYLIAKYM